MSEEMSDGIDPHGGIGADERSTAADRTAAERVGEIRAVGSLPGDLALLARIDPVDRDHLARAWDAGAASATLLSSVIGSSAPAAPDSAGPTVGDLTSAGHVPAGSGPNEANGAAVTAPRRRRLLPWIGAIAAAAVAAVVIGLAPWGSSPAYAIRQLPDGVIEVNWMKELRNGEAIAEDLRAFGIDVQVVAAPASPSMVGEVVSTALPGHGGGPVEGITWGEDGTDDVFTWRIDPNVFSGPLRIELGVEAEPDEAYTVAGEVFEPGEVLGGLHCALGEPLRAEQLVPYLEKLGLTPRWDVIRTIPGRTDAYQEDSVEETPDGEVLWGYAVDSRTVRFSVLPDGVDPAGIDGLEPRLSDVPCTPEMAAGW